MSDLVQTAASVALGSSTTQTKTVTYGEAITQGMPVYQSTDTKYYKADADAATTAAASAIALTPGAADGVGLVARPATSPGESLVNLGATLTVGETYAVSATAGAICPLSDLLTGDYVTVLGVASTSALLDFQILVSGIAKA